MRTPEICREKKIYIYFWISSWTEFCKNKQTNKNKYIRNPWQFRISKIKSVIVSACTSHCSFCTKLRVTKLRLRSWSRWQGGKPTLWSPAQHHLRSHRWWFLVVEPVTMHRKWDGCPVTQCHSCSKATEQAVSFSLSGPRGQEWWQPEKPNLYFHLAHQWNFGTRRMWDFRRL